MHNNNNCCFTLLVSLAFHRYWSRVFHPYKMVRRFPVPCFQSTPLFSTGAYKTRQLQAAAASYMSCLHVLLVSVINSRFYARQHGKRVLGIVILSVRPSRVTTRYRIYPRWDRDSSFSPYDSLESLVSCEQISCRWVRRFPSNKGIRKGYTPKTSLFYHY